MRPNRAPCLAAAAALAAALGALPSAGCRGDAPAPVARDVVLVTVDTLRADHTSLYGYARPTTPNLERWFGSGGRVFERSWSTEASTTPSVISTMTGLLPHEHRVRQLVQLVPADLPLLPQMLPEGWQTAAFVSNMMLTTEASGLGAQFDHWDDFVDEQDGAGGHTYERNATRTTQAVLDWMDEGRSGGQPLFLWVHYMDPHGPYRPPASWKRTFRHEKPLPIDVTRILEPHREPGVDDGLAYVDAYDEEIAYVDAEIGRLLEGLDQRLGLGDALVVFTADHGESMMDHEAWFRHAVSVHEEMVRVPLALRGPGVVAGRSDLATSGVDVAPTVLRAVGLPLRPGMPGVDLRSDAGLSPERTVFVEASQPARDGGTAWRAAVRGSTKWVLGVRKGDCEAATVRYDLAADPGEASPGKWADGDAIGAQLLRRCREDPDPAGVPKDWAFGRGLRGPKSAPMDGEEQLRSLKALGYAE